MKIQWFIKQWHKQVFSGGLVILIFLSGCTKKPLPSQDIVFALGPGEYGEQVRLGLINADGSNLDYIKFKQPWKAYPEVPVWSPNRTGFVYLLDGNIVSADIPTARSQRVCSSRRILVGSVWNRVRWTPDGKYLLAVPGGRGIELLDPQTCETKQVLVAWPQKEGEGVGSPDLSVQNELVYVFTSHYCAVTACSYMTVKNLSTGQVYTLGQGMYPSWSPDGEWLVFTREDGLYLIRRDGSQERRLLEITDWWNIERTSFEPPRASWSPDGEWIVYHKVVQDGPKYRARIFKLHVNSGQETSLGDLVGLNPHWHWDARPIAGTQ